MPLILFTAPLLIIALELTLSVVGYGKDTRFLLRRSIAGSDYWVVNSEFYQQFLSMPVGNILDLDDLGFQASCQKGPGVVRILILGDSAVHGCTPDSAFGFGRFLELFLREQFPDKKFEICNAACPALNSHVMRRAARACSQLHPDIVLVYMGNNEFIGPFGPGVTGPRILGYAAIDRWIELRRFRLAQLFNNNSWLTSGDKSHETLSAMVRSRHDAPERQAMHAHYRENVEAICEMARRAGSKTVVCTVASNLVEWHPFESFHRADLQPQALVEWERLYDAAQSKEAQEDLAGAAEDYAQAVAIDPDFAELQYRLGRVLARLGKRDASLDCLQHARDYDALPLRVDSDMNESLRETKRISGVTMVDVERLLESGPPDAMPDNTLFWDFVHFNFHGNYLFARAVFDAIVPLIAPGESATPLPEEECQTRLGYSGAVALAHARRLLPAFSFWRVPQENMHWLKALQAKLEEALGPDAAALETEGYQRAIQSYPGDYRVRQRWAQLRMQQGDVASSLDAARALVAEFPWRRGGYLLAATASDRAGNRGQALEFLHRLQQIYPDAPPDLAHLD